MTAEFHRTTGDERHFGNPGENIHDLVKRVYGERAYIQRTEIEPRYQVLVRGAGGTHVLDVIIVDEVE